MKIRSKVVKINKKPKSFILKIGEGEDQTLGFITYKLNSDLALYHNGEDKVEDFFPYLYFVGWNLWFINRLCKFYIEK